MFHSVQGLCIESFLKPRKLGINTSLSWGLYHSGMKENHCVTVFSNNKVLSVSGRIVLICEFIALTVRTSHLTKVADILSRLIWHALCKHNLFVWHKRKRGGLFHPILYIFNFKRFRSLKLCLLKQKKKKDSTTPTGFTNLSPNCCCQGKLILFLQKSNTVFEWEMTVTKCSSLFF